MYISKNVINKLEGLNTLESIMSKLKIKRSTAIQYVYFLRKKGLVETMVGKGRKRLYRINKIPKIDIGNPGYYETLNKNSPIKVWEPYEHRIIGRKISIEETIAWAASTKENRLHLSSLALFNKVKNWSNLYKWAKYYNSRRKVGILYEIARKITKVRRIDERIKKKLLSVKNENKYMFPYIKSKDFKDLEKKWRIFVDLNLADLKRYKE